MSNGAAATGGGRNVMQAANIPEAQGFDIVRVLWRWKFLPVLGAIIGMAFGYLQFTRQPPQYIASALVQVVSPVPPSARVALYSPDEVVTYSRADESIVITSERVLKKAAESGSLASLDRFKGMSPEQIAGWIRGGRLTVNPGGRDSGTSLLTISFVCDDPTVATAVVNAVVEGYSDYLSQEYKTVGNEVYELVIKAQTNIQKTYESLRDRNLKFRQEAPLIWTGEGTEDPYANNLQDLNSRIVGISVEKTIIASKLKHAREALDSKRDPEAILMWLSNTEVPQDAKAQAIQNELADMAVASNTDSKRLEQTELFRLQMEEKRLAKTLGENHPVVSGIGQQIALLQEQINHMKEAERLDRASMEEALAAQRQKQKDQPQEVPNNAEARLQRLLQSMVEGLAALDIQEEGLKKLANENEAKSKELSRFIQDNELYQRELDSVQTMLEAYRDKLKQIELLPATAAQRTLKELNLPTQGAFYGPSLSPYLISNGAIGLLIMAGLAVLLDLADKSFRTPEDIAAEIGAPVLGHIPVMEMDKLIKKPNQVADGSLCTIHHSRGRVSEAYRSVRTGLFFSNRTGDLKVIQVTSPVPGDGKSTLSSNLAVTMAQSGRRVLLIDADFRRPRIAKLFGIDSDIGMATVVAGAAELDEAIHASSVANLSVMPGGKRPSNPAELLSSPRFAQLLELLREKFDMIIVDTPPLLAVSDPSAVAAVVDGVVLTMRLRRNVKPLVTRASKILEAVDANVLGIVVNGVSADAGYGGYSYGYRDYRYAYNYRYGYGYKNYGKNYGGYGYGAKQYLEEPHDIDTDHVLTDPQTRQSTGRGDQADI